MLRQRKERTHVRMGNIYYRARTYMRLLVLVRVMFAQAVKPHIIKVSTVDLKTKEAISLFHG